MFPDKKASAFYYDKNNKITQEQLQNRTLENTAVISKHCFIYNEKGQVTKITEYGKIILKVIILILLTAMTTQLFLKIATD